MGEAMDDFSNETATWLEDQLDTKTEIDCELGSLVAAVSDWTQDEMEIDDLVVGLVDGGYVQLSIGSQIRFENVAGPANSDRLAPSFDPTRKRYPESTHPSWHVLTTTI